MKIFFVGDIVGSAGREVFAQLVPGMKARGEVDVVIVNAENAAGGSGITERLAEEIFSCGCDVMTLGDHAWDKKDSFAYIESCERLVRPANYAPVVPGRGFCSIDGPGGVKIGVISLVGRTFMKYMADCPFRKLDEILPSMKEETPIVIVDMHAEATSEKVAMGWHCDGRVSAVCGTHTHIQTADEQVLPQGTGYITDVGMTGPYDSVIGQSKEKILERFLTGLPNRFEVSNGPATLCGVILDVDETSGRTQSVIRVQKKA